MHVSMPEIQAFEVASRTNGRDPSRSAKRCRGVRLPVVVATILIGLVWCPAALARNPKAIWGPVHMPDGSSALPVYRELGVRFLQLGLPWSSIAPTRPWDPTDPNDPSYRWPRDVDAAVRRAGRYGLRIALLASSSPSWANGGRLSVWAPRNPDYADFLTAAAHRYPEVRHWMIWGEPNRRSAFRPMPTNRSAGPRRYATLLRAGYRALKRVSPRNVVIGGMTFTYGDVGPRDFARWMRLPGGRPAPLDWYGHNPFSFRFPLLRYSPRPEAPAARDFSDIDTFHAELARIYRGQYAHFRQHGPALWLSEFTVPSDRGNHAFNYYVTRPTQARWVSTAYKVAHETSYVAALGWFNLIDEPPSVPWGLTTGLMTWNGGRKPAYYAYKRAPPRR
jgi:hypothetical protein